MTKCPDCLSEDLQSLGILRGERIDDEHVVLVSKFKCNRCRCEFKEYLISHWQTEVLMHGGYEQLILMEAQE
jgi:hypothetical protein